MEAIEFIKKNQGVHRIEMWYRFNTYMCLVKYYKQNMK